MRWVQSLILAGAVVACGAAGGQVWCRRDSDCRTYGDSHATCRQESVCVCSAGYTHVAPEVPLCADAGRMDSGPLFHDTLRIMFPFPEFGTSCPAGDALSLQLGAAAAAVTGGVVPAANQTSVVCDDPRSYVMVDAIVGTRDLSALHAVTVEVLTQELQKNVYPLLHYTALTRPTHVGVQLLGGVRCDLARHAEMMEYRHPHCLVTACQDGHVASPDLTACVPRTDAPLTSTPATTPSPGATVPEPTLSPNDAGPTDTVWCRQDSDCRAYMDTAAVCTGWGKCACSPQTHSHLVNDETGRTAYTCVPSSLRFPRSVEKVVAVWQVQTCPQGVLLDVEKALTVVVHGPDVATNTSSGMSCAAPGDAVFTVQVEAPLKQLLTTDLVAALEAELRKNTYSEAVRSLGRAVSVQVEWVGRLQCKVQHASRTHYADDACVVEACNAGYKVSPDARSCEPHEADGGDDGLSGGAIAGIVCGAVAGVALLVGVAYLCLRKGVPAEQSAENEPHNDL